MKDCIIKFKNELKEYQLFNKKLIQPFEREASIIEKILNSDVSVAIECGLSKNNNVKTNADILRENTPLFQDFFQIYVNSLEAQTENKEKSLGRYGRIKEALTLFNTMIKAFNKQYYIIQNIINAFENDKIKQPIEDIKFLIAIINFTTLTAEEANQIIGMTIAFNSRYAKKKKNHNIQEIDIIDKLADYYNLDGSFNNNEDPLTYEAFINALWIKSNKIKNNDIKQKIREKNNVSADDLVELLIEHIIEIRKNAANSTPTIVPEKIEKISISKETKEALQELRKYYRNSTLIQIPENLNEFYNLLVKCGLDNIEIQYIKDLINKEITNQNDNSSLSFLNEEEKSTYEKSLHLLKVLDYSNNDIFALKELIKELQTIIDLLKSNPDEEDKEFLLSDVPNIITELSIICNKYETTIESIHQEKKSNLTRKKTKKAHN